MHGATPDGGASSPCRGQCAAVWRVCRRYNEEALEEASAHLKNTDEVEDDNLKFNGLLDQFPMSPFQPAELNRDTVGALLPTDDRLR